MEREGSPPLDEIEQRWVIAEAEAKLFGGVPSAVTIGRFHVRGRLGAGGLGVVYAVFDPELEREIAVKVMRTPGRDQKDRERVLGEARAMARLAHPNVVPIYEVGIDSGRVFLAMERVVGSTARAWRETTSPAWDAIVRVYVQAGSGLVAAHAAGIVHRDFKPENILVGEDGRARIADFGLVAAGPGAGTPAYMAPEQAHGAAGPAADQYAFAVALWEALSGSRPDTARTEPADDRVPRRIWRALRRALAERPDDRFPTLLELLDALDQPPRRRALRIAGWTIVVIILGIALAGAIAQFWVLRDWRKG